MDRTLIRQLKRNLGIRDETEFLSRLGDFRLRSAEVPGMEALLSALPRLLLAISHTYEQYERDLALRSRSLELSSQELTEANDKLRAEIAESQQKERSLQLAASVFSHAREGIIITDSDGRILEVNDSFTRITGYSREEVVGQTPRVLKSDHHGPEFYADLWKSLVELGHWRGEVWNRRKSGEVYADLRTISAVKDAEGRTVNYVALFTDVTAMKEHQRQLERMAHYDALTGLPNRVLLAERLRQAMAGSRRSGASLAVVFLDLDGFKAINDQHGHAFGDSLLIAIARRMGAELRAEDTLARLGGDEFVAIQTGMKRPEDIEHFVRRLLAAASAPVTVDGYAPRHISASIGVTIYPQDDSDADQLIRHADQAMYAAKQAGKNRYQIFDIERHVAVQSQLQSIETLRQALALGQFVLHYQPKVNLRTGAVVGAEALIRWLNPEQGLLPPGAFLPLIDGHPLAIAVGEWVIRQAIAQSSLWQAEGLMLPVSVNVGGEQLQQADFPSRVAALLAEHPEFPPDHLEFEILETSALEDIAKVTEVMYGCRELGVRFALDDFGTGYSSLTYLKRLPADVLKIDRSFVSSLHEAPENLAIVEGVVGLARAFSRGVIAEGVESAAQGEVLLELGCEIAQGYALARPMPAAEIPRWIALRTGATFLREAA